MTEKRKRIGISIDAETYKQLDSLMRLYHYKSIGELLVSLAHILADRLSPPDRRRYDLPDEDREYIRDMFEELEEADRRPEDTSVHRYKHQKTRRDGKGRGL